MSDEAWFGKVLADAKKSKSEWPAWAKERKEVMFSVNQKRYIADAVQKILRSTEHPELPGGEIQFSLHVDGAESWSWADIRNNGAVTSPSANPWNELQDQPQKPNE